MKFGNLQDWQTDAELEANGVKLEIGRDRWFLIRRAAGSNRAYIAAFGEFTTEVRDTRSESIAEAMHSERLQRIFGKHVVLDWSGIHDEKGEEVPYSADAFVALMQSAPDLWLHVKSEAERRDRFQREHLEREKTQLGKSSNGKRSGVHTARV